jgi:hypothetical protein
MSPRERGTILQSLIEKVGMQFGFQITGGF